MTRTQTHCISAAGMRRNCLPGFLLSLLLAACGGGGSNDGASASSPIAPSSTAPEVPPSPSPGTVPLPLPNLPQAPSQSPSEPSAPIQTLAIVADRPQTAIGGVSLTLTVSGIENPGQTTWTLTPESQGSLSKTSGASVQYIPPIAGTPLANGIASVIVTNGDQSAGVKILLLASSSNGGTADAVPGIPTQPDNGLPAPATGIFLVAGNDFGAGIADGAGPRARFDTPIGIAHDAQGNLYIADRLNQSVRKVSSSGEVTTVAGLAGASGHVDGTRSTARFVSPWGVVADATGNLYVTDPEDLTVRKIAPDGSVQTFAGHSATEGRPAGAVASDFLAGPKGIAIDSNGILYVADVDTVRKMTPDGTVSILAGQRGSRGLQDGPAASATFTSLQAITVDKEGNVYVVDSGFVPGSIISNTFDVVSAIRKISRSGVVSTVAGAGAMGTDSFETVGFRDGQGTAARFRYPEGLAVDAAGNLIVGDTGNHAIRKVTSEGTVTTIAGTEAEQGSVDGVVADARFGMPSGITMTPDGSIYTTDSANHTVRRIVPDTAVSTVAGAAPHAGSADGRRLDALFYAPLGLARDSAGTLYVADTGNQTIRRIGTDGVVSTLAGTAGQEGSVDGVQTLARFNLPRDVAVDAAGRIYVSDFLNRAIRRITSAGEVTTYAGGLGVEAYVNGPVATARFREPQAVALDTSGNVFVADRVGDSIRKISPDGLVSTFAGQYDGGGSGTGNDTSGRLFMPQDVVADNAGNVYFIDSGALVRKVTPDGTVSTLAGKAFEHGSTDGIGAEARFNFPQSLTVDDDGNIYVADSRAIRKITQDGLVTTVAGPGVAGENGRLQNIHRPAGLVSTGPKRLAFTSENGVFELNLP
jgi:sugar lactone lactonase YvrE